MISKAFIENFEREIKIKMFFKTLKKLVLYINTFSNKNNYVKLLET